MSQTLLFKAPEATRSPGYAAYYDLQVQLHSGQVQRAYTVLHHGYVPASLIQVGAQPGSIRNEDLWSLKRASRDDYGVYGLRIPMLGFTWSVLGVHSSQVEARLRWHGDGPTLAGRGKPSRTLLALQWYADSQVRGAFRSGVVQDRIAQAIISRATYPSSARRPKPRHQPYS